MIFMPAVSEKQRKAAGAALAVKRGRGKKPRAIDVANMTEMNEEDLEDLASKKAFDEAWGVINVD